MASILRQSLGGGNSPHRSFNRNPSINDQGGDYFDQGDPRFNGGNYGNNNVNTRPLSARTSEGSQGGGGGGGMVISPIPAPLIWSFDHIRRIVRPYSPHHSRQYGHFTLPETVIWSFDHTRRRRRRRRRGGLPATERVRAPGSGSGQQWAQRRRRRRGLPGSEAAAAGAQPPNHLRVLVELPNCMS